MLIDNFDKLDKLLEFKPNTYYKFVALIRTKDLKENPSLLKLHKDKREIFLKQWFVDSQETLDNYKNDMLVYLELFKCRLYVTSERKSIIKTLQVLRDKVDKQLDQFLYSNNPPVSVRALNKMIASASSLEDSTDSNSKMWFFDVDVKDDMLLSEVEKYCGEHHLVTLNTKHGYHVIARRKFDAYKHFDKLIDLFTEKYGNEGCNMISLKSNELALVAIG